jgi:hypothetical protein
MADLGRLKRLELRDIWKTEDRDFTPWLALEENLKELGDTINMDLELEAQEKNVGPFRADLLCKDTDDGSWVLIENQLERTDHNHLGQLLTYASGLNSVTIIWIASRFTDEHRAALDWLNKITEEKFKFFGLEVEVWKIGESAAAPKFNIISKPNDWSRSVSSATRKLNNQDLNPRQENFLIYWKALSEYLTENSNVLKPQKPSHYHWTSFSMGRSTFLLHALGATKDEWLAVELAIPGNDCKAFFKLLLEQREQIEEELGFVIEWCELPERKNSKLRVTRNGLNPMDKDKWPIHFKWFHETLESFERVFKDRIKKLNIHDWVDDARDAE